MDAPIVFLIARLVPSATALSNCQAIGTAWGAEVAFAQENKDNRWYVAVRD